jgi:hypothetical protein
MGIGSDFLILISDAVCVRHASASLVGMKRKTASVNGVHFDAPTIAAGIAIGIGSLLLVGGLILRFSKQS